jgi:hypothetical protein
MMNLVLTYFEEVMSKANADACHRILDSRVVHKDMVRNEGRYGIMVRGRSALLAAYCVVTVLAASPCLLTQQ